uniref:Uncharacterized protein n=1 Tax=Romanomermis culicivorax TaxID=13658 RepID=A0A915KX69_ROMCU
NSVKPNVAIFESDAEAHRRQQLYAINENDRHKLYGGRMNDARRIEVKVITQEAVKTLHTFDGFLSDNFDFDPTSVVHSPAVQFMTIIFIDGV